jgi:quercetin dioxygenase-like cupin family protein
MLTVDFNSVEAPERFPGLKAGFPLSSAAGAAALATVWIEVAPGGVLPEHTDSAEELLFVVEGEVEATVGDETGTLGPLELAVVPALAPHGLRNVSDRPARILGVFASSTAVSVFTDAFGPDALQVFVIGAPLELAVPLPEPIAA